MPYGKYNLVVICIALFFNCSGNPELQQSDSEPLTDVLTLELSFGDDITILPEEYLLVRPRGLNVNNAGEMLVPDERKIKIYNSNGRAIEVIGSAGQGPGEFSSNIATNGIIISPEKYLTVKFGSYINIYDPNNEFLEKIRYNNLPFSAELREMKNWQFWRLSKAAALNNHQRIWEVLTINTGKSNFQVQSQLARYSIQNPDSFVRILVFEDNGNFNELENYPGSGNFNYGGRQNIFNPFYGSLYWSILPDNSIIYLHSEHDKFIDSEGTSEYTINVYSTENYKKTTLSHPFEPVPIPKSEKNTNWTRGIDVSNMEAFQFYRPVQQFLTDGFIAFAFTTQKNLEGEFLADIFDMQENKYLRSAYFDIAPDVIKDGYAYVLKTGQDIFPVIEKYRIDPRVYRK